MTPRGLFAVPALLTLLTLAILAACGGDGGTTINRPGQLTDPRSVPMATPWASPPEVIPLEPGAITPLSGGGPTPSPGGTAQPGECGDTYVVQSGDYPGVIAEKCGITVDQLLQANPGIEPTNLKVGQELVIPH